MLKSRILWAGVASAMLAAAPMTTVAAAQDSETAAASSPRSRFAPTWGTTQSVLLVDQSEFVTDNSADSSGRGYSLTCAVAGDSYCGFLAPLRLPNGARLLAIEVEACDNNGST